MKLWLPMWPAVLAFATLLVASAAQVPQQNITAQVASAAQVPQQNVTTQHLELYLLAEYGTGFPVTVSAPHLMAQLISNQQTSCPKSACSSCVQSQAVVMSHVTERLVGPNPYKAIPPAAKCTAPDSFQAGSYSLQASAVAGADKATWSCLEYHQNGSATSLGLVEDKGTPQPSAELRMLSGSSGTSNTSNSLSESTMTAAARVELSAGNSYICVASYSPAKSAAAASAAQAVVASSIPQVVNGSGASAAPTPASPPATAAKPSAATSKHVAGPQTQPVQTTAENQLADKKGAPITVTTPVNKTAADIGEGATAEAKTTTDTDAAKANTAPPAVAGTAPAAVSDASPAPVSDAKPTAIAVGLPAVAITITAPAANVSTAPTAVANATTGAASAAAIAASTAAATAAATLVKPISAAEPLTVAPATSAAKSTEDQDQTVESTDSMTYSTTDMTTDQTTTTTVTYNPATGDILSTDAEITATCLPPAYKQPPRGQPAAPLAVSGNMLINTRTKQPIYIHGINWFGFNTDLGMLNGLWAGGTDAATDFSKIAFELKLLGYNAVRLPFAYNFLNKTAVWDAVRNCTTMSDMDFKIRMIDPQDLSATTRSKTLPSDPSPMRNKPRGSCNTYLPANSNQDRLLFVVQQFIALGMYVVLDYQPQGLEQYPYNLAEFVGAWKSLWQKVTCLPNFNSDVAGRILLDVMNEPDSMNIKWEANGQQPGAEQLYLTTAQALWQMTPNKMLFMFEGTGQNMYGLNWGNGFITDINIITSKGLSNPIPFFQQLVQKPFVKNVIISPHLYPPSITKSTYLGQDLWKQSNTTFGYLQSTGFCNNGTCTRFPIVIGETGSAYTNDTDKIWLQDFAKFVMAKGSARAYNKLPLAGWMWWAFNENSGDTGGIVMNNWQDLNWIKLRYMVDNLGLQPWYKQPSSSSNDRRRRSRRSRHSRGAARGRISYRRPHRRHGGHKVTFDWDDLGFDIGRLPVRS